MTLDEMLLKAEGSLEAVCAFAEAEAEKTLRKAGASPEETDDFLVGHRLELAEWKQTELAKLRRWLEDPDAASVELH